MSNAHTASPLPLCLRTEDRLRIEDRARTGDASEVQFEDCVKVYDPDHGFHLALTTDSGTVYHHRHTFHFGFGMHSGHEAEPKAAALARAEALLARVLAAGVIDLNHWYVARTTYGSADWSESAEVERERAR